MGMGPSQSLRRIELPLASPVILAGIRVSVIINVATSTIGAIAGAGGLGAPIISGLVNSDPAVTLQGAVLTAALALDPRRVSRSARDGRGAKRRNQGIVEMT